MDAKMVPRAALDLPRRAKTTLGALGALLGRFVHVFFAILAPKGIHFWTPFFRNHPLESQKEGHVRIYGHLLAPWGGLGVSKSNFLGSEIGSKK